mmetsp:Transcript_22338/g.59929  ORF Transcript_22338/g.59929 Transcript_22338/m.59929 type:complete len:238 (+) Transcript_22338:91-804(+)
MQDANTSHGSRTTHEAVRTAVSAIIHIHSRRDPMVAQAVRAKSTLYAATARAYETVQHELERPMSATRDAALLNQTVPMCAWVQPHADTKECAQCATAFAAAWPDAPAATTPAAPTHISEKKSDDMLIAAFLFASCFGALRSARGCSAALDVARATVALAVAFCCAFRFPPAVSVTSSSVATSTSSAVLFPAAVTGCAFASWSSWSWSSSSSSSSSSPPSPLSSSSPISPAELNLRP